MFMKRYVVCLISVCAVIALCFSAAYSKESRGVKIISIKDQQGKEIKLYKESHALIIGASNYTAGWPKLPGVKKDVEETKRILEKHGFNVTVVADPSREQLIQAFEKFINKYGLRPDNRLLFYFAGHGHTIKQAYGEEMGYIVPVDAPNPNKDKDGFFTKAMDMQQIEVFARRIQSKHAIFLFDSCFSGSIFALSRAVPENISYKTATPVRQFITSGSAEEQVPDKSIFLTQFVSALSGEADMNKDGYVTGTELGEYLQGTVVNYSKGSQHPQYGKIRNPNLDKGDFVFQLASIAPTAISSETPSQVISEELSQLREEKAMIKKEREELAQQKAIMEEKKRLEEERQKLEKEKTELAMAPRPSKITTGSSYTDPTTGMELVLVKGGCFQMGDTFGNGDSDEKPVHEVCADDFYIGKYEVTQGQWKEIMVSNPSWFKDCGDNCPVEQVSWNAAQDFIKKLNQKTGKNYRLPTEVEWEYAARSGGKSEKYSGGNDADSAAWYSSNSGSKTHPVGTKSPNGLGIYDMSGSVWEWVQDWYDEGYYRRSPRNNPRGADSGTIRVLRGGSWANTPANLRASDRNGLDPSHRYADDGFRVVRTK